MKCPTTCHGRNWEVVKCLRDRITIAHRLIDQMLHSEQSRPSSRQRCGERHQSNPCLALLQNIAQEIIFHLPVLNDSSFNIVLLVAPEAKAENQHLACFKEVLPSFWRIVFVEPIPSKLLNADIWHGSSIVSVQVPVSNLTPNPAFSKPRCCPQTVRVMMRFGKQANTPLSGSS